MYRFSAAVAMQVTYGYNVKGGETFVKSMQRALEIFLSVATPEITALYSAFPFGELITPDDMLPDRSWIRT